MIAVGDQVTRDLQREGGTVGEHNRPLYGAQGCDFGSPVGGGDRSPLSINWFTEKVRGIEGDGEGTPCVHYDGNGNRGVLGCMTCGSQRREEFGLFFWGMPYH